MAARTRQLVSTLPTTGQRQQLSSGLPEYQPAQFTLSADAQRQLHSLTLKHKFDKLGQDLNHAITSLTNTAADVNERVSDQRQRLKRARPGNEDASSVHDGASEEAATSYEQNAEKLTKRMEQSLRKMIDTQQSVIWLKDSLSASETQARNHASTQASLPVPSRTRAPRQTTGDGSADESEEDAQEQYSEIDPTAPADGTQPIIGPSSMFKEQFELRQQRYKDTSLAERYTDNADFRNYKNMVHNSLYPDEDVPQPAPGTWFREQPPARPGITQGPDGDGSDEEDIQMTRAVMSTKCPITLQEFKNPVSSNKCPHTYEASAILEMLKNSSTRSAPTATARTGEQAVQCPVQGCTNLLTRGDLHEDQLVLRRVKRLQRAREIEEQELQERGTPLADGTQRGALTIDDGYDVDDIEDEEAPAPSKRFKREMRSSMR